MLDRSTVDRLRTLETRGSPVVSVYLGLDPDPDQLRSIATRVKALVNPLREAVAADDPAGRPLRDDLDAVVELAGRASADLGRGAALFVGSRSGLKEYVGLPAPVRDRAVVDVAPYLGPMEAMLAQFRRFCAVVVDRRNAWIYRFYMGELEAWEQIGEEEVRKDNYGGFAGYEEQRVRAHAETVARRLFRSAAGRAAELFRGGDFEFLIVGGQQGNVAAFVGELAPDLQRALAGTFSVDPRTASPADVRSRCREVVAAHERAIDEETVAGLLDAAGAGGRAVLGLDRALDAANQRAVDRLLIETDTLTPGVRCPDCAWVGTKADACPVCGSATRGVPDVVDAMAEVVRSDGGSVRYITARTPLEEHGVGAILRFPAPELAAGG